MPVTKLSISLDPDVETAVRVAAAKADLSVSAWLAEAAAQHLRHTALAELVEEWLADGTITEESIATAGKHFDGPPVDGVVVVSLNDDVETNAA